MEFPGFHIRGKYSKEKRENSRAGTAGWNILPNRIWGIFNFGEIPFNHLERRMGGAPKGRTIIFSIIIIYNAGSVKGKSFKRGRDEERVNLINLLAFEFAKL